MNNNIHILMNNFKEIYCNLLRIRKCYGSLLQSVLTDDFGEIEGLGCAKDLDCFISRPDRQGREMF